MQASWKYMGALLCVFGVGAVAPLEAALAGSNGYDASAPTLLALRISPQVDVQSTANQAIIEIDASDDGVGIQGIMVSLIGPTPHSGVSPSAYINSYLALPSSNWRGRIVWSPDAATVPGRWSIAYITLTDLNGNSSTTHSSELVKMGAKPIEVINRKFESLGPRVSAGRISTPIYSVSTTLDGSPSQRSFAKAEIDIRDVAERGQLSSGVDHAELHFCRVGANFNECMYWWNGASFSLNGASMLHRSKPFTLELFGRPEPIYGVGGEYQIYKLLAFDAAGNMTEMVSQIYGGSTDFSQIFSSTTMTVKP